MCRYLPSSAVNRPVGLGVYTKAMMNNRILTICAAMAAGLAGTSLAHAQQGYPAQGQVYSTAPGPYVPGGYATDERRGPGEPDFDALDDDDAPNGQNAAALPPTGPVLSPDDPRYGRPAGPPPVIYADRPPGSQQQPTYSDRGDSRIPGAGIVYPNDDRAGLRPPGAIGAEPAAAPGATGALPQPQQPAVGADGRPVQLAALPPEEQPEVGPAQLPPHLR